MWHRSVCRPLERMVEVEQEYPGSVAHIFSPRCVPLHRCAGCCNDEILECSPTLTHNVTIQVHVGKCKHTDSVILGAHIQCVLSKTKYILLLYLYLIVCSTLFLFTFQFNASNPKLISIMYNIYHVSCQFIICSGFLMLHSVVNMIVMYVCLNTDKPLSA